MFKFRFDSGFVSSSFYVGENEIKFNPPVYEQRYCMITKILEERIFEGHIKKVVDFGCAEMKLFSYLKRVPGIEHVLEVDTNQELLQTYTQRVKPLLSDYLDTRATPLRVDVYKGSIATSADCLRNTDAVIGIEIIEHLYPEVLENVPYNVFGFIRPKVAIFTTPNSEYNVYFNLSLPSGFRHHDHKFEWDRKQFENWCYNICKRFPNYAVAFQGVGKSPKGKTFVGYVSQIAIFIRNDIRELPLVEDLEMDVVIENNNDTSDEYELLYSGEFPYSTDTRDHNQSTLDDIKYHINRHMQMAKRYYCPYDNYYKIPLKNIFDLIFPKVITEDELKRFLITNSYTVNNDNFIEMREFEESDQEEWDNVDENLADNNEPEEMWD